MSERKLFLLVLFFLLLPAGALADGNEHTDTINVSENLGRYVPLETGFLDENGRPVKLADLMGKPTIVAPVYLSCTHTCPMLLSGLADVVGRVSLKPGKDYTVVTFSFDEQDTPAIASDKKKNYLKAINKPFPEEAWHFLTGDLTSIKALTESVGFSFRRDKNGFSHPVTLIILSPDGKIVRYLYGITFLPFDLTMALTEAAEGRVGFSARKTLLYCFSYDPRGKTYVFNILKVVGTVIVIFLVSFFVYLLLSGRKRSTA